MIQKWVNWRSLLGVIAVLIATGTIFYSESLAKKIASQEHSNVAIWVEAQKTILNSSDTANLNLATRISSDNINIPIIETDEKDNISNNYLNLDTLDVKNNKNYLSETLAEFKEYAPPIVLVISQKPYIANKYYYGPSTLLKQVKYYPMVQLVIVFFFIIIILLAQRANYNSKQNQVWAGLAKETAHQLGTPVSSLQGWLEMMKEIEGNEKITPEIEKDINRLLLITDRFGKIGSKPILEEKNIIELVGNMVDYIKKRAGVKVNFELNTFGETFIPSMVCPPLFDWVIENLLKNGLDAMEGKGNISINIKDAAAQIIIDISDTGKGINSANVGKVFNPGFSTKQRGWGLGLTLSKRIIEQYHKGQIYVLQSEIGKGTTFRVILNK
ncbi:sensor histidine kinase [Parasediminibacterium sp. JCM 36343]|uniref:sensor histidine kinase n=1 Tax=Parasediminibacterium sp. JCM 36343 TaxID=3374279 RepID=UPI00397A56FB